MNDQRVYRFALFCGTGSYEPGERGPAIGAPMGYCDDPSEAQALVSCFPGQGKCHLWDCEEKRVVRIMSWSNSRASN